MARPTKAAVFFTQRGHPEKQQRMCLGFCDRQRWQIAHIIPWYAERDAVRLVREGQVDVIVAAVNSAEVRRLAADIGDRGKVVYVHPKPTVVRQPDRATPATVPELIVRWFRRGRAPKEIALDIGSTTRDVRDILRRAGEDPD